MSFEVLTSYFQDRVIGVKIKGIGIISRTDHRTGVNRTFTLHFWEDVLSNEHL